MSKALRFGGASALLLFVCAGAVLVVAQHTNSPLPATRLLALVAGNSLPETIVAAIETRGLTFKPAEQYVAQLMQAGATAEVVKALSKATVHGGAAERDAKEEASNWQQLSLAGKLIREKSYEQAKQELTAMLQAGDAKLEAQFVMGEALRQQGQWAIAADFYSEIVKQDKFFPEAQTKLSFALYRLGDQEGSLQAAKAALATTPNNAEAHKNAGLALSAMGTFDAAADQFHEALHIKPDYEIVLYDLGNLFYAQNNMDGAVSEFQSALQMNPKDVDARVNLALAYGQQNNGDAAIRELRAAKRLDPGNLDVRQNLGSLLMRLHLNADAVVEMRELEAMAPESAVCHVCLAAALYATMDYPSARKEYEIAIRLDPTEVTAYQGLGRTEEVMGEDQRALQQYLLAEKIDPNSVETRLCIARILLKTNQPGLAVDQLSEAVQAEPRNAEAHHQYGRALDALGNLPQAKSEYQESLLLDGENAFTLLHLAQLLEKLGDWTGAMENYRSAAKRVEASLQSARGPQQVVDAPGEYQKAQARLNQHLAQLKAAGKSSEATELQAQIAAAQASLGTSGELDATMEAGSRAYMEQKFEDAEKSFKEAVRLAESIHPRDQRLVMAFGFLGTLYHNRKDDADAERTFEEQLKVAEEVYGEGSPKICPVLQTLARFYLERGDAPRAESFAQQELTLAEKNAGNDNFSYSMGLMSVGYVYLTAKQYAKAEPYIQKAVNIHEQLTGPQRMILVSSKKMMCTVYDGLSQTDKAEPCYRQLLPLMEQVYGANSQALAPVLTGESQALRALGRTTEADDVDRRMQSLQPIAPGQVPRMVPTH